MDEHSNRRILIIDDRETIHEDMRKILARSEPLGAQLDEFEEMLFESKTQLDLEPFELSHATQGEQGLQMVRDALVAESPYTVAFVDVRMPPGWDGITTTGHIMAVDREIQIVICSAYSDHSPQQILRKLGFTDRLLYLRKPFDVAEVVMLATTLNMKWHLARAAATFTEILAERAFDV